MTSSDGLKSVVSDYKEKKMPNIYFTKEEIEELLWIVPQFKDTHEEHYIVAEKEKIENIIKKLIEVKLRSSSQD